MSKSIGRLAAALARGVTLPLERYRAAMAQADASQALQPVWTVQTSAGPLSFVGPSRRCLHYAKGFHEEEPETVAWIEGFPANAVFWDIGANVGVYAIFAAKRGVRVLAFEPAAGTLAVLTANIERNGVDGLVQAYGVALAEDTRLDTLFMAAERTEPGHAVHSFGTRDTVAGPIQGGFRQAAVGFSMDGFAELFGAPRPTHVKLDVDGIEPAILRGGRQLLTSSVREVMVEIFDDAPETGGPEIRALLEEFGYRERPTCNPAGRNKLFARA